MTLDEMKSNWKKENDKGSYDESTIQKIVKTRVRKHTNTAFKYFWAAFVLQLMVYSMLTHVIVKYWYEPMATMPALIGIAAFGPFTVMMMRRFKGVALLNSGDGPVSLYIARRRELLEGFYRFKRRYELVLVPLATFIGTFLVFELYVPGGVWAFPKGALITFFVSLASCIIAIQAEYRRNFEEPLLHLKMILDELSEGR